MEFIRRIPLGSIYIFAIGLLPLYIGIRIIRKERQFNKKTVFASSIIAVVFLCGGIPWLYSYLDYIKYKEETTPLSQETISILCNNFSLEKENKLCSGKKEVYAPDFYDTIENTFGGPVREERVVHRFQDGAVVTFDSVEDKLGMFRMDCEPVEYIKSWDQKVFRCFYDLHGDEYTIISFYYYYPEMTVFRIGSRIGWDD